MSKREHVRVKYYKDKKELYFFIWTAKGQKGAEEKLVQIHDEQITILSQRKYNLNKLWKLLSDWHLLPSRQLYRY